MTLMAWTLSAAAGGVTGLLIKRYMPVSLGGTHIWDIGHTCNSLLGGLVGITAGCSVTTANHSILIGVISAFVYHLASCTMRKFKIDDPLDAFAVHGACGFWGVFAVGLFSAPAYAYGSGPGLFYGEGKALGAACICLGLEIVWVVVLSALMFLPLKLAGLLRVSAEIEAAGMDVSKHGGAAYTE